MSVNEPHTCHIDHTERYRATGEKWLILLHLSKLSPRNLEDCLTYMMWLLVRNVYILPNENMYDSCSFRLDSSWYSSRAWFCLSRTELIMMKYLLGWRQTSVVLNWDELHTLHWQFTWEWNNLGTCVKVSLMFPGLPVLLLLC